MLPEINDSFRALCAKEMCKALIRHGSPVRDTAEWAHNSSYPIHLDDELHQGWLTGGGGHPMRAESPHVLARRSGGSRQGAE